MISKLEILLALAKERHFGRAAESLGITQPSLSSGLRALEDQLGVKLVERGARFGGLTPEGQRALEIARTIVGETRRLRAEMRLTREGLAGHLRLAVIPTALTRAARLTARFSQAHPRVGFTLLSRSSHEILEALETLDADAGITYLDNEPLGRVSVLPLYREHYALLCAPDHPLAARGRIGWGDLRGARLCLLTPDMQNRRIVNRHFMEAGITPEALVESDSTIALATHVIEGGFVTVLPAGLARFMAAGRGLAVVPVGAADQGPSVGLVALHQEPYTPVLRAFRAAALEMAAE